MRAGLTALGWREELGGDVGDIAPAQRALAARLLMSLALVETEQGHPAYGLRLLEEAQGFAAPEDSGILHLQRGSLWLRTGRWQAAIEQFTDALALLGTDAERLSIALLNRAVAHLNTGDVRHARNDLRRAREIATESDLGLTAAKAAQNIGYCDLLTGDIPAALGLFDVAAATYQRMAPAMMPVLETDRSRALLAAGLAADAIFSLDSAIGAFRRQRNDQYCAEAELDRAQAAIAVGDLKAARGWSLAAMRRFRARGNDAWAALAELTRLRASLGDVTDRDSGTGRRRAHSPARLA